MIDDMELRNITVLGNYCNNHPDGYPPAAYAMLRASIDEASKIVTREQGMPGPIFEPRDVGAEDIVRGFIRYMKRVYGKFARHTLKEWRIESSDDLGRMMQTLVDLKVIVADEDDDCNDFCNGFTMDEIFGENG